MSGYGERLVKTKSTNNNKSLGTEQTRLIDFKRAHYRFYTSTPQRPITMESQGAVFHAQEIWEDYRIDIYDEMKRRRRAGTLQPNQFMTFVRETVPPDLDQRTNIVPNEIHYDPSLVHIPV